jgi:hypothetical protein
MTQGEYMTQWGKKGVIQATYDKLSSAQARYKK